MELDAGQLEAVEKLKNGSILCGGVGSGKSRTALAYYFVKVCGGSYEPMYEPMKRPLDLYIITTAKKRDSREWEMEMTNFMILDKSLYSINVVVDSWNNIQKYVDVSNAFFIFDEQRIVGSGSWVKAFYKITDAMNNSVKKHNNKWLLLTATPGDSWSDYIPVFVAHHFYKNKTEFLRKHAVYSRYTKYPSITKYIDTDILHKYRESLLVDIKVEKKTKRNYQYINVDYDKELLNTVMKKRWDPYSNEPIEDVAKLCYICRRIVNENKYREEAVMSLLLTNPKVIIFYNFDYELELLRKLMDDAGILYSEWNGHRHEQIPTGDRWAYLVQYTAGAEGWNCIETDTIIFYSLNYSYKITEQASGRIDRRNTHFTDLYYYFIKTNAWIDRAIKNSLDHKKSFNERKYRDSLGFNKNA